MDRETLLRRAAKLMQFTAGNATVGEVELASEMLAALLAEHNLSLADVTVEILKRDMGSDTASTLYRHRWPAWYAYLTEQIAMITDTQSIKTQLPDMTWQARFYGSRADVMVAAYFCSVISRSLLEQCKRVSPPCNKSFLLAGVQRVCERLAAILKPVGRDEKSRSLSINKSTAVKDYIDNVVGKTKALPMREASDIDPLSALLGTHNANKIELNHGVRHDSSTPRLEG